MLGEKIVLYISLFSLFIVIVISLLTIREQHHIEPTENTSTFNENIKVAIIIGIDNYDKFNGVRPLRFAVADAQLINDTLKNMGYETEILTNDRADKNRILDIINFYAKKIGEHGTLVFFFSGHGVGDVKNNENYLIPAHGKIKYLEKTALSTTEITNILKASGVKRAALFLDACRNEMPYLNEKSSHDLSFLYKNSSGFHILYAAEFGSVSYEPTELRHGVFSYFLNKGLRGKASTMGAITLSSLTEYVQIQIPKWLEENKYYDKNQKPYHSVTEGYGRLVLGKVQNDYTNSEKQLIGTRGKLPSEIPHSESKSQPISQIEVEYERLFNFLESLKKNKN